jgi:hypothetical protein
MFLTLIPAATKGQKRTLFPILSLIKEKIPAILIFIPLKMMSQITWNRILLQEL